MKNVLNPILQTLADWWWVPLFRGIVAVLFGVVTLLVPGPSLFALVLLWGAYAFADGAISIVYSIRERRTVPGWGWLLFQGLTGIAAGVVTFFLPAITGLALLFLIATWALIVGAMQIAAAIVWRRELTGEWRLVLSGVVSLVFGALIIAFPGAGALSVAWMIGAYAVAFGVLLIALSIRLYRLGHPSRPSQHMATHAA